MRHAFRLPSSSSVFANWHTPLWVTLAVVVLLTLACIAGCADEKPAPVDTQTIEQHMCSRQDIEGVPCIVCHSHYRSGPDMTWVYAPSCDWSRAQTDGGMSP